MSRPRFILAATVLWTACGDGDPADVPSNATGHTCNVVAHAYDDARKCSRRDLNIPVCFREVPAAVPAAEWMCTVSAQGNLFVYGAPSSRVFYYPGWTFGPASRTRLQPAFKATLSPKDEVRCAAALEVQAQVASSIGHPPYCGDTPEEMWWPVGTSRLTVKGTTSTARFLSEEPWSTGSRWEIGHAPISKDPSHVYKGMFLVRWKRDLPPSRGAGRHPCEHVTFLPPTDTPLGDQTFAYHLNRGDVSTCPRPATCDVNVTALAGEGYPTSGKFTVRNLRRSETDCADAVDLDGTFEMPRPEL